MVIFPLTVHPTYYAQGFFNVRVEFDRAVRRSEGPVTLIVGDMGQRFDGRIDRSANNKTARIMGGVKLRDWFQSNCRVGDTVFVDLTSTSEIRITKINPTTSAHE